MKKKKKKDNYLDWKYQQEERIRRYKKLVPLKTFKINENILLKLIEEETIIFVNGEPFLQCKSLIVNIPTSVIKDLSTINSIDELQHIKDNHLSYFNELVPLVTPEQEFWGHCSNIQVWVEHDYDNRMIHSNLAFPLLKQLTKVGDPKARKVFKDEIIEGLLEGFFPKFAYLMSYEYVYCFIFEELHCLMKDLQLIYKHDKYLKYQLNISESFEMLGDQYFSLQEFNKAIILYQYALEFNPNNYFLWNSLGGTYIKNREFKKGLKIYEEAVQTYELLPSIEKSLWNCSDLMVDWADVYINIKNYDEAIEKCNSAIKINPDSYYPWYYMSLAYSAKGDVYSSKECLKKYKRLGRKSRKKERENW